MFAKNLSAAYARGEDRPTGYWVAHSVLIVVNLVIGGAARPPGPARPEGPSLTPSADLLSPEDTDPSLHDRDVTRPRRSLRKTGQ